MASVKQGMLYVTIKTTNTYETIIKNRQEQHMMG